MEEESGPSHKQREFICACGKNYLSYAALFTHIKQKHDGKAPGPIVRPRSERKRGRPRKNPAPGHSLKDSQQQPHKSENQILGEGNTIIDFFEHKKKQAAQLLGCGSFKAFKTFQPEKLEKGQLGGFTEYAAKPDRPQLLAQPRQSGQLAREPRSSLDAGVQLRLKKTRSAPAAHNKSSQPQQSQFHQFVVRPVVQVFENHEVGAQEVACRQILEIFDCFSSDAGLHTAKGEAGSGLASTEISIQCGFKLYIQEIGEHLQQPQRRQVSFLLSLLYEFVCLQVSRPANKMQAHVGFDRVAEFAPAFLSSYLPARIEQLDEMRPLNLVISLCNRVNLLCGQNHKGKLNSPNLPNRKQGSPSVREDGEPDRSGLDCPREHPEYDLEFEEIRPLFDQIRNSNPVAPAQPDQAPSACRQGPSGQQAQKALSSAFTRTQSSTPVQPGQPEQPGFPEQDLSAASKV